MGKTISIIGQSLVGLIYIIELIIAIRVAKHKNLPNLARKFYWYPLIGTIVWLVITLKNLHILSNQIAFSVNTISLLFHYSFLSFFIFSISGKKKIFKLIILCCFFFTILLIISDLITEYLTSFAFANSCLFFFSAYYFYLLFKGAYLQTLSKNFTFYTACGIFIGSGLMVPSALMIKYLYLVGAAKPTLFLMSAIGTFGYLIMNIIFIKALLCLKPNK